MKTNRILVISGGQGSGKTRLASKLAKGRKVITLNGEHVQRLTDLTKPASRAEVLIIENAVELKPLIAWAALASESCSLIITTQYPASSADLGVRVLTFT